LAIEVLSRSNTPREMQRKLREYFEAGVKLVWFVDPEARTVTVHDSPAELRVVQEGESLDGGSVLPGFVLPLRELFSELDRQRTEPPAATNQS
jgi:Uma2 family endonuclease